MPQNAENNMPSSQRNASPFAPLRAQSFMGRELSVNNFLADSVDVVVTGVPFDLGASIRPGARYGPTAIRSATTHLDWELRRWPWDFNVFDKLNVVDCGDLCFDPTAGDQMVRQLQHHAAQILATEKRMLTLGGDHFITLPLLREHAGKYGPVAMIHFDAHADSEKEPGPFNHGAMFYHALKEGLLVPKRSIQIGLRTEWERENHMLRVLDADWLMDHSTDDVLKEIKQTVGDHPAYVTFDIDCLDPAFAPGTGTPVVGGLSTAAALKIIRGLVGCNLVGMDIVEVSPPYDHAEITALAAASLSLEFLYVLAVNRKTGRF